MLDDGIIEIIGRIMAFNACGIDMVLLWGVCQSGEAISVPPHSLSIMISRSICECSQAGLL